ncbi:hypothetical protein WR25_02549, partial [Diploscapter pachys]
RMSYRVLMNPQMMDQEGSSNDDETGEELSSASRGVSEDNINIDALNTKFATTYEECERTVVQRLSSLYPHVDTKEHPLPRIWNKNDASPLLSISHIGLRVQFTKRKSATRSKEAASVRANFPIPLACGVYYYEVTIVKGQLGCYMGIGVCSKEIRNDRLPGWDNKSYGYHGDDGNFFNRSGNGTEYASKFGAGDVVGCGVNLIQRRIFFTKNGKHLGVACKNMEDVKELYPIVGLQSPDEIIDVNFGQKPFLFDLHSEVKSINQSITQNIVEIDLPVEKKTYINRAIASFLAYEGCTKTLSAFNKRTDIAYDESEAQINNRKKVIELIKNRRPTEAIDLLSKDYPDFLNGQPHAELLIRSIQLIELSANLARVDAARKSNAMVDSMNGKAKNGVSGAAAAGGQQQKRESTEQQGGSNELAPSTSSKRTSTSPTRRKDTPNPYKRSRTAVASSSSPLDVDGPPVRRSPPVGSGATAARRQLSDEQGKNEGAEQRGATQTTSSANGNSKEKNGIGNGVAASNVHAQNNMQDEQDKDEEDENTVSTGYGGLTPGSQEYLRYAELYRFGKELHRLSQQISKLPQASMDIVMDALCSVTEVNMQTFENDEILSFEQRCYIADVVSRAIHAHNGRSDSNELVGMLRGWAGIHRRLEDDQSPACAFEAYHSMIFGEPDKSDPPSELSSVDGRDTAEDAVMICE